MYTVVNLSDIYGAIKDELITEGRSEEIENVLSDLERHFSPVDYETEM